MTRTNNTLEMSDFFFMAPVMIKWRFFHEPIHDLNRTPPPLKRLVYPSIYP